MRAAAAADLAAQPVAFADPHVTDADGDAKHADPVANNPHHDAHPDINPADPDADRTDIGTSHDQPGTDNDGQRHRGHSDPSGDCDGDSVRRHCGTDAHADVQPRRQTPAPATHHCCSKPASLAPRPRQSQGPPRASATPTAATPASTASGTPTDTSSHNGAKTVQHAAQVSLCVEVARAQASSERGQAAQWTVSAWTTGGNVPDAVLRLQAAPASAGTPVFSFGCGKNDGKSTCDLGVVDAKSAPRQLQARLTVPVTASAVKSVSLTVTGAAAHLAKDPKVSEAVSITAPPPATAPPAAGAPSPERRHLPPSAGARSPRRSRSAACPASLA